MSATHTTPEQVPVAPYLTTAELRSILDSFPDDYGIILAKDAEGNDFSPCASVQATRYQPNSAWSGDIGPHGQPALVLWPLN